MPTKPTTKTAQSKRARNAVAVAAEPKASSKSKAKVEADSLKQKVTAAVEEAVESVRESSRENLLAGLGMIARVRQQRDERKAELVEEGKRFEPEVKQAFEDLKAKLKIDGDLKGKFDLKKLKFDTKGFDREALKTRIDDGMANTLRRMGLATRKEVDVLARDVARLTELQDA
ncbi:MAG TPA: phasin family protein [Rubrivivax sp.]|nr:phasin family protein [Pseudomonadota bacterium]HPP82570.1 phasin family protein [Rubrivivax sp.]